MIRRWWRSLGFYWQVYIYMVLSFGSIVMFVESVVEPLSLDTLRRWMNIDSTMAEALLWLVSVLLPTLLLGYLITQMVMRKLDNTVKMAKRLSCGDLGARIAADGDEKDVFNQLAQTFNSMAGSLERLLSHEKRLLADISHELRSPLTRMGIATALLTMKRDSDDFERVVKVLDTEIDQMNRLVGILLEQGRDRLRAPEDYAAVDLTELAGDMADAFSLVADDGGKHLTARLEPGIVVWGDQLRIRMILENILSNALRYAPVDSRVEFLVRKDGETAVMSIRDQGCGVPQEYLEDIFTAFFRVDESRARTSGGVGLGLTLAKDAVIAMGGDIAAANATPGLVVTVRLPCCKPGENENTPSSLR